MSNVFPITRPARHGEPWPDAITVVAWRDPVIEQATGAIATTSDEFLTWWTSTLGPSSVLVARHLALYAADGEVEWPLDDLAGTFGLGRTQLGHTLDRLSPVQRDRPSRLDGRGADDARPAQPPAAGAPAALSGRRVRAVTVMRPDDDWCALAACRGLPTAMFYPLSDAPAGKALAVCARCPVRAACDEHAVDAGEEYGIWGGRTETERARAVALPRRDARAAPARPGVAADRRRPARPRLAPRPQAARRRPDPPPPRREHPHRLQVPAPRDAPRRDRAARPPPLPGELTQRRARPRARPAAGRAACRGRLRRGAVWAAARSLSSPSASSGAKPFGLTAPASAAAPPVRRCPASGRATTHGGSSCPTPTPSPRCDHPASSPPCSTCRATARPSTPCSTATATRTRTTASLGVAATAARFLVAEHGEAWVRSADDTTARIDHDGRHQRPTRPPLGHHPHRNHGDDTMTTTEPATGATADTTEPELCWLNLTDLAPHPDNPRTNLGDLSELVRSINAHGILEPLVVLPADDNGVHLIVAGHRRHAAGLKAGVVTVPVVVRAMTPAETVEAMLSENVNRSDLTVAEEIRAIERLMSLDAGLSPAKLCRRIGKSQAWVRARMAVTVLPDRWRTALDRGDLTLAAAEAAATLADLGPDHLDAVCAQLTGRNWIDPTRAVANYRDDLRRAEQYQRAVERAHAKHAGRVHQRRPAARQGQAARRTVRQRHRQGAPRRAVPRRRRPPRRLGRRSRHLRGLHRPAPPPTRPRRQRNGSDLTADNTRPAAAGGDTSHAKRKGRVARLAHATEVWAKPRGGISQTDLTQLALRGLICEAGREAIGYAATILGYEQPREVTHRDLLAAADTPAAARPGRGRGRLRAGRDRHVLVAVEHAVPRLPRHPHPHRLDARPMDRRRHRPHHRRADDDTTRRRRRRRRRRRQPDDERRGRSRPRLNHRPDGPARPSPHREAGPGR